MLYFKISVKSLRGIVSPQHTNLHSCAVLLILYKTILRSFLYQITVFIFRLEISNQELTTNFDYAELKIFYQAGM